MVNYVGMPCAETQNLSAIPRTNTVEEDTDFGKLFCDLHTPAMPLA